MKKIIFGLAALAFASSAFAWVEISAGAITELGSGWYYDDMWVKTTGAPQGTLSCSWDNTT